MSNFFSVYLLVIILPYFCLTQLLWSVIKSFYQRDSMEIYFSKTDYLYNVHISRHMIKMQVLFHIFLVFKISTEM